VSRAIDGMHLGRDRVICSYEVDGLIIDPGPTSCLDALLAGLGDVVPRALLLTHIHLDHAGASGELCRRFPGLEVYVHERGAPHVIDPSKLMSSAQRLYGDRMDELWGAMVPVPEERVHVLRGGETVEGFRVAYTPGHASHHVAYLHEATGDAYTGDVAGVRIPPHGFAVAPTPPPDIDVELWLDSIEIVAAWNPARLCLTHFGYVTEVTDHLHRVRQRLLDFAELARDLDEDAFVARLGETLRGEMDEASALSFEQAAPPDQLYKGLERYWRKRAEAAEGAAR
jgi:glyoxylase-like metal-dependent hydrolase (beta-lactamase superfamily II)